MGKNEIIRLRMKEIIQEYGIYSTARFSEWFILSKQTRGFSSQSIYFFTAICMLL